MAILFTGDMHGEKGIHRLDRESFPEGDVLDRGDFVIIAGDFQLIYDHSGLTRHERQWLEWLSDRPWTTLFIDGNHEHMPRLRSLPLEERFGARVGRAAPNVYYLLRGERYEIDDRSFLCLGGAHSIDRDRRVPGESWFHEEVPTEAEVLSTRMAAERGPVDVFLTHTCPPDIKFQLPIHTRNDISDPTEHFLAELRPVVNPRIWIFGHFHVNWKGREGKTDYVCLFDEIALLDPKLGIIPLGKKPMTKQPGPVTADAAPAAALPMIRLPNPSRLPSSSVAPQTAEPPPENGFGTWGGE
ncbi:MAG: metallophosphoesterase [Desulfuromonadales bacterium]